MTPGTLTFIGLGLYDAKDLSLKALDAIHHADVVYAEFYTSKLAGTSIDQLQETIGTSIIPLTREQTEHPTQLIADAQQKNTVLLTCGDPMTATTHVDLRIRAHHKHIPTYIIHSSSIITAAPGLLGLQIYKFGRTTTLAYPEKNYFPTSPYDVIKENLNHNLHTLILLDIQAHTNRYMTATEGITLLQQMEHQQKHHLITPDTLMCVVGQAGSPTPTLAANTIATLLKKDFGPPLHCLIYPGKLHFMEFEALQHLAGLPEHISKKIHKI